MTEKIHLAVVDDEADIRTLLGHYLGGRGFRVSQLASGAELMALMQADPPALILLDLGLQGEDGLSIARQVRARWQCGLVIVTGRGDAVDKIVGLEVGADDYVTKPFDLRELLARVNAVLRRVVATRPGGGDNAALPEPSAQPAAATGLSAARGAPPAAFAAAGLADAACAAPTSLAAGPAASAAPVGAPTGIAPAAERMVFADWVLDTGARTLTDPAGRDVPLTTGEFDLLGVLVRSAGRVLTRDYLLEQTRGRDARPFDRTIDVQVARLRKKLAPDPDAPPMIKSVRSVGYVFVPRVHVHP
ncbi:MAG: winged helix-turn-helix domain-containing protein [Burkholderiaceae bacterium]